MTVALYLAQVHPPRAYLVRVVYVRDRRPTVARIMRDGTAHRMPFQVTDNHQLVTTWPAPPAHAVLAAIRARCMPPEPMAYPLARAYIRDRMRRAGLT